MARLAGVWGWRRARVAAVAGAGVLLAGVMTLLTALTANASDTPPGFWYGTDSSTMSVGGHSVPYKEPALGTWYGGYVGMAGNWANITSCHKIVVWSGTNASQANANFASHVGVGTGAYWFMGGPGVDPHYNCSTGEAAASHSKTALRQALCEIEYR